MVMSRKINRDNLTMAQEEIVDQANEVADLVIKLFNCDRKRAARYYYRCTDNKYDQTLFNLVLNGRGDEAIDVVYTMIENNETPIEVNYDQTDKIKGRGLV